eukprot:scaffold7203_cov416-Prasinococcus_capsulatus_cf.AAC.4
MKFHKTQRPADKSPKGICRRPRQHWFKRLPPGPASTPAGRHAGLVRALCAHHVGDGRALGPEQQRQGPVLLRVGYHGRLLVRGGPFLSRCVVLYAALSIN